MRIALYYAGANIFGARLHLRFRELGHKVLSRDPRGWQGEIEQCGLVIIKGARRPDLVKAYQDAGIPVFVFDWGYIDRVNSPDEHHKGHWQLSYAKLNGFPDFDVPSGRLEKLAIDISRKAHASNKRALLIGQMPKDAAVTGTCHATWLRNKAAELQADGFDVFYREHPRGGLKMPGLAVANGPLLDEMRASRVVVTYNSNTGHDALRAGVPVLCDPVAPYAELSGMTLPSLPRRRAYFQRLAYGQWRANETAEAVAFILGEWLPRVKA
jgi:hypothetical protein